MSSAQSLEENLVEIGHVGFAVSPVHADILIRLGSAHHTGTNIRCAAGQAPDSKVRAGAQGGSSSRWSNCADVVVRAR